MCFISLIDALYGITMFFISLIAVHTLYCCIVYHCSLFSMISLCVVLYNINMFLYDITTADEVICRQVCRLLSLSLYFNTARLHVVDSNEPPGPALSWGGVNNRVTCC